MAPRYNDTVNSWAGEDGTVTPPEDHLSILSSAYDDDIAEAGAMASDAAKADIDGIIALAVQAAVDGIKAQAFEALMETAGGDTDTTDSGADGSENDEEPDDVDEDIDDLFRQ